ncbi:Crp/Fnr family transcriptional regulator [Ramlibacter sp.]|uniref:Crp/Fnr family transcriptional regulator n=1 Tax=Ramlibacter sp. TaxID=1917967 RepID=UPI003D11F924
MSLGFLKSKKADLSRLQAAVESNPMDDTLGRAIDAATWDVLAEYLTPLQADRGHILIAQGALDRSIYFVESGQLRVHRGHEKGQLQLAILGPGAIVGEGSFFSTIERSATVQAVKPCVLWELTPSRFEDISKKHPQAALTVAMALGAVLSTRMLDVARKISIT